MFSRRDVLAVSAASAVMTASAARAASFGNPDQPPQGAINAKAPGTLLYEEISLSNWLAHTPSALVAQHLNADEATIAKWPENAEGVMPRS